MRLSWTSSTAVNVDTKFGPGSERCSACAGRTCNDGCPRYFRLRRTQPLTDAHLFFSRFLLQLFRRLTLRFRFRLQLQLSLFLLFLFLLPLLPRCSFLLRLLLLLPLLFLLLLLLLFLIVLFLFRDLEDCRTSSSVPPNQTIAYLRTNHLRTRRSDRLGGLLRTRALRSDRLLPLLATAPLPLLLHGLALGSLSAVTASITEGVTSPLLLLSAHTSLSTRRSSFPVAAGASLSFVPARAPLPLVSAPAPVATPVLPFVFLTSISLPTVLPFLLAVIVTSPLPAIASKHLTIVRNDRKLTEPK